MKPKQILHGVLAASLAVIGTFGTGLPVHAAGGNADATVSSDGISIGNGYLERNYSIKDGHIVTSSIENKRINLTTVPGAGSEDFVINTISEGSSETEDPIVNDPIYEYTQPMSTEGWTASLYNKDGTAFADNMVQLLFDGDLNTYVDNWQISGLPMTLDIDFGSEKEIAGMSVNKRPGYADSAYGTNGTMGTYEIWTSENGTDYTKLMEGEFTKEDYNLHKVGDLYNVGDMVYVNFENKVKTQYVRVVQTGVAFGTAAEFSSAEVDFYADPVEKTQVTKAPTKVLDRSNWDLTIKNASGQVFDAAHANRLIDGDLNTNPDEYTKSGNPFTVDIDLGSEQTVSSLSIDKRPGFADANFGTNGTMGEFELYVSDDGQVWKLAGAGNFTKEAYNLHEDNGLYNVGDRVYANFYQTYTTRYVRLVQKSCSMGSSEEFTSAELNLYEDQYYGPNWNTTITPVNEDAIYSSNLIYAGAEKEYTENGVKVTISYEPYELNGVIYTINQVVVMENDDHYMRSFLEISVSDKEKARIDYIDTDRFVIPEDAQGVWSRPDDSQISSMWIGKHELMLGQPIYLNGLFMGSEFPAEDTIISDNATQIRYYSGKNFAKLEEDGQLTTDGKFVSWQNVIGAAQGTDTSVVQTDFFSYIEEIATPTEFRKQYNSWYDNMMSITDESIASSFNGAEAGLAENGIEPLDSYVVDDGWNNYYSIIGDRTYVGPSADAGSGTPNQTGFWEFNNKFPNELYTSSSLSDKFGSTFGVWVGPQGGYNYFTGFAQYLEASGTGEAQTNSALGTVICTGSRKYLANFEKMAIDFQDRFNVEYWKWDGFASRSCNNPNHDHMTGGDNNMYFTSDMWEAWTDLFDAVRANNPNIFINATCYVNLSPWLLQWVNTIWVQDSGDTGQLGTGERHEQKIYYRDQVYYQLYKQNQIQFPLKNIYNHDPIYGVSDGSSATTEVFREYLFANAVRGTAFWELYYSPSLMDDAKWKVTADVLTWAEDNHEILKNAKLFGNKPSEGVYGYSSWNGEQGIISFTNPLDTEQTYELTVDDTVGAVKTLKDAVGVQVEPYVVGTLEQTLSYGDTLTVTLAPHETKILQYNANDASAPSVVSAEMKDNATVQVKFSERVNDTAEFTVNGVKAEDAVLMDDYRTVELKMAEDIAGSDITVEVKGLTDQYGNAYNGEKISFKSYKDNVVADLSNVEATGLDGETGNAVYTLDGKEITLADEGVEGTGVFSAAFSIRTQATDAVILKQGDAFTVRIDEEGYIEATIGSKTFNSKEKVTTVTEKATGTFGTDAYVPTQTETSYSGKVNDGAMHAVAVVREANGMLKIYIDGKLATSLYDENALNEALTSAPVVLGSSTLTATMSDLKVVKAALDYNEAAQLSDANAVEGRREFDRSSWTATACSEMSGMSGDASAQAAIDGNLSSWWHTNYVGGDTCGDENHWIAVDFGETLTFDSLDYTGRGGSNGDVKEYNLYIKDADGEWVLLVENGEFDSGKAVNTITFDQPVTTSGIKFELLETVGGFGAAKEIQVFRSNSLADADSVTEAYQAAKEVFDSVDPKDYTEDSYQAYEEAFAKLGALKELSDQGSPVSAFVLEDTAAAVDQAYANLVKDDSRWQALNALVKELSALNEKDYTADTWKNFKDKLDAAKALLADETATGSQLEKAKEELQAAYAELKVDKTALESIIASAEKEDLTNKTEESVAALKDAIAAGKLVLEDENATAQDVANAVTAITEAVKNLKDVSTEEPSDPSDKPQDDTDKPSGNDEETDDVGTGAANNLVPYALLVLVSGGYLLTRYKKSER